MKAWEELHADYQRQLIVKGDPRVPLHLRRPVQHRGPRNSTFTPQVTVRLEDFIAVSEEDMWLLLQLSWNMQKIKPPTALFLVNGQTVEVPVPWRKLPVSTVRRFKLDQLGLPKLVLSAPPPRVKLPLVRVCEHCHKEVTARSYSGFHGPKCFRAP